LKPTGVLLLGGSESIGNFEELFVAVDAGNRIFAKKEGSPRQIMDFGSQRPSEASNDTSEAEIVRDETIANRDVQSAVDKLVLSRFAPPGVVINEALEVLQFRGKTGPYLEAAPGTASFNILKMAREGLLVELRAATRKAKKGSPARAEGVHVRQDGEVRSVNLEVVPIDSDKRGPRNYLVRRLPQGNRSRSRVSDGHRHGRRGDPGGRPAALRGLQVVAAAPLSTGCSGWPGSRRKDSRASSARAASPLS
jgi:two-component system, chemotaxis family, CheB/CheR fusion protein